MKELLSFDKEGLRAVIVAPHILSIDNEIYNDSTEELKLLAKTLGMSIVNIFTQTFVKPKPQFFVGRGKLEEVKEYIIKNKINIVLFTVELSGIQARNIEKFLDAYVFGRTEIILNIFSKRARTNIAKLQVQLAWLEYLRPRLRHRWDHFSRVQGGIGLRGGEGEKQLELDRRMIKEQIARIKKKLKRVDKQMKTRRKRRLDANLISIVGYTNAGKTSLLNILAKTDYFAKNMLFATLDSTIKKVFINDELTVLIQDTVGFINDLPHTLVVSFKSTLDEIALSKLVLHVIDVSSKNMKNKINSVHSVLNEIGAQNIPIIRVFNKIDLVDENEIDLLQKENDDIFISVKQNLGIEKVKEKINEKLYSFIT